MSIMDGIFFLTILMKYCTYFKYIKYRNIQNFEDILGRVDSAYIIINYIISI